MSGAGQKRTVSNATGMMIGHLKVEARNYADGGREVVFSFFGRPVDWMNLPVSATMARQLRKLADWCDGGGDLADWCDGGGDAS